MVRGDVLDIGRVERHQRMKMVEIGKRRMTKSIGTWSWMRSDE